MATISVARPTALALPTGHWRPGASTAAGLAAPLLGALITLAIFGPAMLNPWQAGWMLAGPFGPDPAQYQLAWRFFAQAPWSLPPGANPGFGMELSSGIFYADAIPLLALPLKLLAPGIAQYWGPWLLLCGVLQGWFGWVLMGRATANPWARVMGAGLLVLQPMLLNRMGGHLALAGQWTLLAALALALQPPGRRQGLAWLLLVPATALIHAYLLAMVGAIWAADAWRRRAVLEALAVPAATLAALWAAGFFMLSAGHGAPGYGAMMFDLFAPLHPGHWGTFLPDLPQIGHPESDGLYLGLGGLLLLLAGLASALGRPLPALPWALALALAAMLAFAITPRLAVLGHVVVLFELPGWASGLAGSLRASERFAWPFLYAAMVLAAMALAARLGGRRSGMVLTLLLAIQLADLRPGMAFLHGLMASAEAAAEPVTAPFWHEARPRYGRLRAVPPANRGEDWSRIAHIAATHGMVTDAIYLARIDAAAVEGLAARLAVGMTEPGTLYVLRDAASLARARATMDPAHDLLIRVDGLDVLAPGWR